MWMIWVIPRVIPCLLVNCHNGVGGERRTARYPFIHSRSLKFREIGDFGGNFSGWNITVYTIFISRTSIFFSIRIIIERVLDLIIIRPNFFDLFPNCSKGLSIWGKNHITQNTKNVAGDYYKVYSNKKTVFKLLYAENSYIWKTDLRRTKILDTQLPESMKITPEIPA